MDDLQNGTCNKWGDRAPNAAPALSPFRAWPPGLLAALKCLPGYVAPRITVHMAAALLSSLHVLSDVEAMKTLGWSWALRLCAVNAAAIGVIYGSIQFLSEFRRKQGTRFKRRKSDHVPWSFVVSTPLWTLAGVLFLWVVANGWLPWLSWSDHPAHLAAPVFAASMGILFGTLTLGTVQQGITYTSVDGNLPSLVISVMLLIAVLTNDTFRIMATNRSFAKK